MKIITKEKDQEVAYIQDRDLKLLWERARENEVGFIFNTLFLEGHKCVTNNQKSKDDFYKFTKPQVVEILKKTPYILDYQEYMTKSEDEILEEAEQVEEERENVTLAFATREASLPLDIERKEDLQHLKYSDFNELKGLLDQMKKENDWYNLPQQIAKITRVYQSYQKQLTHFFQMKLCRSRLEVPIIDSDHFQKCISQDERYTMTESFNPSMLVVSRTDGKRITEPIDPDYLRQGLFYMILSDSTRLEMLAETNQLFVYQRPTRDQKHLLQFVSPYENQTWQRSALSGTTKESAKVYQLVK